MAGDTLWTTEIEADGVTRRLASVDVRNGEVNTWVDMPTDSFLVGSNEANHPLVYSRFAGSTYAFNPATKQFDLSSPGWTLFADAERRLEVRCDEHLACHVVLRGPRDGIRDGALTALADFPDNGDASLAPGGEHALIVTYSRLGASFDVVNTVTLARSHLLTESFNNNPVPTAWSADGTWLFLLDNGRLLAWRDGLVAPIEVQLNGAPVLASAIGVFPNA